MNLDGDRTQYGIMSAILGGIAMICWLVPLAGLVVSLLAIRYGNMGIDSNQDGWSLAGLVLGVTSFVLVLLRSGLVYFYG